VAVEKAKQNRKLGQAWVEAGGKYTTQSENQAKVQGWQLTITIQ